MSFSNNIYRKGGFTKLSMQFYRARSYAVIYHSGPCSQTPTVYALILK